VVDAIPAPEPVEPSTGLGSKGFPLILDSVLATPGFWIAPAAFTGEKLDAMKDFAEADSADGLVAGLGADVFDEFDEMELFLFRRLPPWESW